jgi:hypothetical protein
MHFVKEVNNKPTLKKYYVKAHVKEKHIKLDPHQPSQFSYH